jgi:hypothetical protein
MDGGASAASCVFADCHTGGDFAAGMAICGGIRKGRRWFFYTCTPNVESWEETPVWMEANQHW